MLNNYFILKSETEFLNRELKESVIADSFILEKDVVGVLFKRDKERVLRFHLERDLESVFLDEFRGIGGRNVLSIFPAVASAAITDVSIMERDRVVLFNLSNDFSIIFYAVPNKANLFVIKDGKIADSYRRKSEFLGVDFDSFVRRPIGEPMGVGSGKRYNYFGKYYREELDSRLKLSVGAGLEETAERLEREIVNSGTFIIYERDGKLVPSLIDLRECDSWERRVYGDVNSMVGNFYRRYKFLKEKRETKSGLMSKVDGDIKRVSGKILNLKSAIEEAKGSEVFKMYGDVLLTRMAEIPKGSGVFEFKDESGNERRIRLNAQVSVQANANHYYTKYKGLKKSVDSLMSKLDVLKREYDALILRRADLEREENFKILKKMDNTEALIDEREKLPFRIFKLSDKFEVWVGKDSASNDLLTVKYTNQYDLWFHVRGFSGSHTTLKLLDKNLKPEKEIILKTASIAAYYSKARNGKHVPVAYTEKKYVKKRKGFKQGAVVMEKEKIVFVNPAIPEM